MPSTCALETAECIGGALKFLSPPAKQACNRTPAPHPEPNAIFVVGLTMHKVANTFIVAIECPEQRPVRCRGSRARARLSGARDQRHPTGGRSG